MRRFDRFNETIGNNQPDYLKDEFNRVLETVEGLSNIHAEVPLEVIQDGGGVSLRLINQSFWARISGNDCSGIGHPRHSWHEIVPLGDGTWKDADALGVMNAYEINGNCIDPGTVVRMRPGSGNEFLFDQCCPTSAIINSSSSSSGSSSSSAVSSSSSSSS